MTDESTTSVVGSIVITTPRADRPPRRGCGEGVPCCKSPSPCALPAPVRRLRLDVKTGTCGPGLCMKPKAFAAVACAAPRARQRRYSDHPGVPGQAGC